METDEKHFNELQQKTRAIASTWILAGFGAIAYFIKTTTPVFEYFSTYTMINLLSLMVVVGLFILWVLDQLIYQRLLNANFVAGLYNEYRNNTVAPVRVLMVIGSEYQGMTKWYNLFYFIPMLTFTLLSTFSWAFELFSADLSSVPWMFEAAAAKPDDKTLVASTIIGVALLVITTLIWRYIYDKKRDTPFTNLLEAFGDEEFTRINSREECARIIQRWDPASQAGRP